MLEFRTLGLIDLRGETGERIDSVLLHAKRLSLLAYLSSSNSRGLHRRDTLVGLLWPDLDEAHARGALRHELYELRRCLGPGVLRGSGGEAVGIDPQRLWCDASSFEAAVDAGRLEEALELWRGGFLPGLHVSNGAEFERWLDERRDRLVRQVVDAGRRLSVSAEEAADPAAAVSWARRLTELAPYDETGWQRLIQLLDRLGDRAGALVTYDALTARLRDELEVEPSPETRALVKRIRERGEAFAIPARSGPAVPDSVPLEDPRRPTAGTPASTPRQPPDTRPAPRGSRQTSPPHLLRGLPWVAAALLVLAALTVAWKRSTRVSADDRVVIEFPHVDNLTGDSAFEVLRHQVEDRLVKVLADADFVQLIKPDERSRAVARVTATLHRQGDAVGAWPARPAVVEVRVRLAERRLGGEILAVHEAVLRAPDDPNPALDTLVWRVAMSVAHHYDARFEAAGTGQGGPIPIRTPSFEAFREYFEGSALFGRHEYAAAATHLLRANEIEPWFAKPAIFGAIALAYSGNPAKADSVASHLLASADSLAAYDRFFCEWFLADLQGRRSDAYRAAREFERAARGGSPSAIAVAATEAMRLNRPREAMRSYDRVNVDHGWLRGWTDLWEWWAGASHMSGKHRAELTIARRGRDRFPESLALIRTEVRARAALRQPSQVERLIAEALTLPAGPLSPADVAWTAAQELAAHGQAEAAAAARRTAVQWLSRRSNATPGETLLLARILLESGDADEAQRLLGTLPPREDLEGLGLTGLSAATRGDTGAAREVLARLEGMQNPHLGGRHLLIASGIRAALGEPELAVQTLQRASAAGLPFSVELHALPMLRPLAGRRDFRDFLRPRG